MKMVNILILLMLEDRLPSVLSSCCVLVQGSVRCWICRVLKARKDHTELSIKEMWNLCSWPAGVYVCMVISVCRYSFFH